MMHAFNHPPGFGLIVTIHADQTPMARLVDPRVAAARICDRTARPLEVRRRTRRLARGRSTSRADPRP